MTQTDPPNLILPAALPAMNTEPLDVFVTDMAMVMAGTITTSDSAEGLSAEQLGVVFFSATASYARTLPDYNPDQDVSGVIQLGVAVYGESVYATVAASLARLEADLEAVEAEEALPAPEAV